MWWTSLAVRSITIATRLQHLYGEKVTRRGRCDLYYKLHGFARPISMKSDIIRKRSRNDARIPLSQRPRVPPIPPACHPSYPLKHRSPQPPQILLDTSHLPRGQ